MAAGLFNPVVFKRLTPSWKADEIIPYLNEVYAGLEKKLEIPFLFFVPIAKVLESENEMNQWLNKKGSSEMNSFLGEISTENIQGIDRQLSIGNVINSGYLDIKIFLEASLNFFKRKTAVLEEVFDFNALISSSSPVYKGVVYDDIIFCEGFHVQQNPYFSFLPFKPVNGDVLTIRIPSYTYNKVLNKNFFLLPFANATYKLGATYNWNDLTFKPNEEAKLDLLKRLSAFVGGDIEVLSHEAGIRPSAEDRRPILGAHPTYKNIHIFNGLGTKGVMLAPYFAKQMGNYLVDGVAVDEEVSISRYYHLQK